MATSMGFFLRPLRPLGAMALAAVLACSSAATPAATFSGPTYARVTSSGGGCTVAVRTSPQPPQVGVNMVELTVTGADGVAMDGLAVELTPMMPAHGHGSSVHPTVEPMGGGVYVAHEVSLYMAGTWELHTHLGGSMNEDATIVLDVR